MNWCIDVSLEALAQAHSVWVTYNESESDPRTGYRLGRLETCDAIPYLTSAAPMETLVERETLMASPGANVIWLGEFTWPARAPERRCSSRRTRRTSPARFGLHSVQGCG